MPQPLAPIAEPSFTGLIGIARRDITPPVGIYCRMWGSAVHDVAEGIHRPLTATALAIRLSVGELPVVLVGLDLGWWRSDEDERFIREPLLRAMGLDASRVMINLSHTHAGPAVSFSAADKPGGDKILPYMEGLRDAVIEAAREAVASAKPAILSWGVGRCDLARDRQFVDPASGRVVIGYNPAAPSDDTLLVGRVTDASGRVAATLVNYACHPTTLGGANRLISPDYIGAMREVVEGVSGGAPCLYLHGAAGELGPRRGYSGDVAVADANGHQLGHAAAGVLSGMLPAGKALGYAGIERSGTELGRWDTVDITVPDRLSAEAFEVDLPLKLLPSTRELAEQVKGCGDRVMRERLERAMMLSTRIGGRESLRVPIWLWRLGDAILVGTPCEAHSPLQTELRRRFPRKAVVVMNIVNGYMSYLPPVQEYAAGSYQAEVALFKEGCLERVIVECAKAMEGAGNQIGVGPAGLPALDSDP